MAKIELKMEVVARLKKSAEEADKQDRATGLAAGEKWAKEEADAKVLRRLDAEMIRLDGTSPIDKAQFGDDVERTAVECALFLEDEADAAEKFWQRLLGKNWRAMMTPDFFEGFGKGALEVWDEARSQF